MSDSLPWLDDQDIAKLDPFDPKSWPLEEQSSLRAKMAHGIRRQKEMDALMKLISDRQQPQPLPTGVTPAGRPFPPLLPLDPAKFPRASKDPLHRSVDDYLNYRGTLFWNLVVTLLLIFGVVGAASLIVMGLVVLLTP